MSLLVSSLQPSLLTSSPHTGPNCMQHKQVLVLARQNNLMPLSAAGINLIEQNLKTRILDNRPILLLSVMAPIHGHRMEIVLGSLPFPRSHRYQKIPPLPQKPVNIFKQRPMQP